MQKRRKAAQHTVTTRSSPGSTCQPAAGDDDDDAPESQPSDDKYHDEDQDAGAQPAAAGLDAAHIAELDRWRSSVAALEASMLDCLDEVRPGPWPTEGAVYGD